MFIALSGVVVLAIALISFLPRSDKAALHTHGVFHQWGHFFVFCILAFAAARTTRSRQIRVLLFVSAIAFGCGIELLEALMAHASVEWNDVLIDAVGVLAGTLLALFFMPRVAGAPGGRSRPVPLSRRF